MAESTAASVKDDEKKMFLTMSDLMSRLNENLAEMDLPDDKVSPRVELQKRLPDGSTRRADEKDLAAVDLQTKIKQAAAFVSRLQTREEKIQWAEQQRLEGNKLYAKGDYRGAMDVYLTCLVAKMGDDDKAFVVQVLLPVLNNLALCALQLKMWSKTDQFCTLALEETDKFMQDDDDRDAVAKIYFRRGKSRRLQGLYKEARSDLEQALRMLGEDDIQERRSVQREIQKLDKSEMVGIRNEKRQERAMKRALGGTNAQEIGDSITANQDPGQRRKYSTLTAKRKTEVDDDEEDSDEELSCWQHYLLVVVQLTERALELLGDEETIERIEGRKRKTEKEE